DGVVKSGKDVGDADVNVLAPFRFDDLRLLDVVRIKREIFFWRLDRSWFFFFRLRFLGGFRWSVCGRRRGSGGISSSGRGTHGDGRGLFGCGSFRDFGGGFFGLRRLLRFISAG